MNTAYFQLTKRVLLNAKWVIAQFHIVKHNPNGKIESKNILIKTMKLISYGFESV